MNAWMNGAADGGFSLSQVNQSINKKPIHIFFYMFLNVYISYHTVYSMFLSPWYVNFFRLRTFCFISSILREFIVYK